MCPSFRKKTCGRKPRELANRWPNNHLSAVTTAVGPILLVYSCLSTERDFRVYNYFAIFPNLSIRGQAQSPTSVNTLPVLCYWNKLPVSLRQLTTSYQSLYSLYNCRLPTPFTLSCSVDLTLHRPNALTLSPTFCTNPSRTLAVTVFFWAYRFLCPLAHPISSAGNILFSTCPSASLCVHTYVRARMDAFSDRLAVVDL